MQFDLFFCWPVPDSSFPENSQSLLVWLSQHLILIFSQHFRLQNVKVFLIASKILEFSEHKREICQIFFRIEGLPTELKTVHINGEIRLNTSDQSHVVILTQIISKHSGPNGCQDLALCGFWEITIGGLDLYGRDNSWLIKCIVLLEENLGAIFVLDQLGHRWPIFNLHILQVAGFWHEVVWRRASKVLIKWRQNDLKLSQEIFRDVLGVKLSLVPFFGLELLWIILELHFNWFALENSKHVWWIQKVKLLLDLFNVKAFIRKWNSQ